MILFMIISFDIIRTFGGSMNLLEFIKALNDKDLRIDFAQRCKTTPAHLMQVARGYRRAGEDLCINIDRETGGVIRCEDLRPDVDWAYLRASCVNEKAA
jgi:hypothetical protein